MTVELKIKSKHLALEPAIIRIEEQKLRKQIKHLKAYHQVNDDYSDVIYPLHTKWAHLANHRKWNVRNEARATYLARAYLAGKSYKSVEQKREDNWMFTQYIVPRIFAMVAKYGENKLTKYWNGKTVDYKENEKKVLTDNILEWSKID